MPLRGSTVCKTRIRAGGRSLLRLDAGDGRAAGAPTSDRLATVLRRAEAVLVCDYGRDVTADSDVRDALIGLARRVPVVWDPHPRGAPPAPGCRLVTPNETEAVNSIPGPAGVTSTPTPTTGLAAAAALRAWWRCDAVAITLGARGAALATADGCTTVPVPEIEIPRDCDPCGAGDAFAAAVTGALLVNNSVRAAVAAAVRAASRFVADGGAASVSSLPTGSLPTRRAQSVGGSAADVVARLRRRGGRLVATGGCFDLLHAGHLSLLRHARALGDALVVCVNSDESVRRRKGPGRPIVPAADRIALLEALEPVDAVIMFDEDTPTALLETLRPDLWVKGGDYTIGELPEAVSPPTVLVLRALGLGDLLTAVPALRGLRSAYPDHRLVLAAPAPLRELAMLTAAVDDLLPTASRRAPNATTRLGPLRWRQAPPAIAVNLHGRGPQSIRALRAQRPTVLLTHAAPGEPGPEWVRPA